MALTTIRLLLAFLLIGLMAAEAVGGVLTERHRYSLREWLCNVASFVVTRFSRPLTSAIALAVLFWVGGKVPWRISVTPWTAIAAFFCVDFLYYWQHRAMHTIELLWPFHAVHHSSPWYNLSTSLRLPWFAPLVGPYFYLPAVLLGFRTPLVLGALGIVLFYQYFIHTAWVGRLGPLEGVLNTPSAHRVHHAHNPEYLDKNFGGVLLIWDRLFGTYTAETEAPQFGVTTGFEGHNPIWIQFAPFVHFYRRRVAGRSGSKPR